jgi:hypothetical protein
MRYFAIGDAGDRRQTTNVFIHNGAPGRADLVVYDRNANRWVHAARPISYLFGEESDRTREIFEAEAEQLVAGRGCRLPTLAEVEGLPPENARSTFPSQRSAPTPLS